MTILTKALSAIGLMKRSEHGEELGLAIAAGVKALEQRDAWEAKFKKSATDLAKQAEEIERLSEDLDQWRDKSMEQSVEISDLRAKFKLAATDLANKSMGLCDAQAELRATESLLIVAENDRDALRPDALLWRKPRDKRAKNRGGEK